MSHFRCLVKYWVQFPDIAEVLLYTILYCAFWVPEMWNILKWKFQFVCSKSLIRQLWTCNSQFLAFLYHLLWSLYKQLVQ